MSHARLSPSARHRWGACAGSIREEALYPEPPSGPAAIDGTHSHTLLEWCIENKLADPVTQVGVTMRDDGGEFIVGMDRAKRVQVATAYIRECIREFPDAEVLAEEKVNTRWLLGRDDIFGTVDCQIWTGDLYEVIDYKDGMHPVEAKDNPQLEIYALGALSRFKLNEWEAYPFQRVRLTIIQPKLALKGLPEINSYDYLVTDLLAGPRWVAREQAAATDDPNATLTPGEKQCRYCAAKGGCAALAGYTMKEVGLMFQSVITSQSVAADYLTVNVPIELAHQAAEKDPTKMGDAELTQVLEAVPLLKQFIEGVQAEALKRLENGKPVPGFKLVRGPGRRAWALPEDEIVAKLKQMGIPKGAIYKSDLVSPAQAEKLTWLKKDVTTCLSDNQVRLLGEFISSAQGKLTVAPESDPRASVVVDASVMFSAVPVVSELPAFLQSR